MRSLLSLQGWNQKRLLDLFQEAERLRGLSRKELLKLGEGQRVLLYFEQASSRTFLSFANAAHLLGYKVTDIRDTKTSSVSKGESVEDTFRTFASYVDVIVARTQEADTLLRAAKCFEAHKIPVPLISAGHGALGHPTQALLDLFTIWRDWGKSFKMFSSSTWVFSGDLKRGRTVHSLIELLEVCDLLPNTIVFSAPKNLQWKTHLKNIKSVASFSEFLPVVDVLYMTRVQNEWGGARNPKRDILGLKELGRLKKSALVLHPLPRREEIAPECDHDSRIKIWEQEENGLWLRAALLSRLSPIR